MGVRVQRNAERGCRIREEKVNPQTKTLMYPRLAELDSLHERTFCGLKELIYSFDSIEVIQKAIKETDGHLSSMVRLRTVDYINDYISEVEASSNSLFNRIYETMDSVCKKVDKYIDTSPSSAAEQNRFSLIFDSLVYKPCEQAAKDRKLAQLKDNLNYDDLLFKGEARTSTRQSKRDKYLSNRKDNK